MNFEYSHARVFVKPSSAEFISFLNEKGLDGWLVVGMLDDTVNSLHQSAVYDIILVRQRQA